MVDQTLARGGHTPKTSCAIQTEFNGEKTENS